MRSHDSLMEFLFIFFCNGPVLACLATTIQFVPIKIVKKGDAALARYACCESTNRSKTQSKSSGSRTDPIEIAFGG